MAASQPCSNVGRSSRRKRSCSYLSCRPTTNSLSYIAASPGMRWRARCEALNRGKRASRLHERSDGTTHEHPGAHDDEPVPDARRCTLASCHTSTTHRRTLSPRYNLSRLPGTASDLQDGTIAATHHRLEAGRRLRNGAGSPTGGGGSGFGVQISIAAGKPLWPNLFTCRREPSGLFARTL